MIFPLHSEILWTFQLFQTYVSSSRYTHICSNYLVKVRKQRCLPRATALIGSHTSVCIISNKSVACSIVPENGVFSHLAQKARFASSKWFITKWFRKSIFMEFLHALYTDMTQTAVPQISCTIIINFSSFGINIMNMCITTIEIQQTMFIGCMTIEGLIHVNRTTIILDFKWITILQ